MDLGLKKRAKPYPWEGVVQSDVRIRRSASCFGSSRFCAPTAAGVPIIARDAFATGAHPAAAAAASRAARSASSCAAVCTGRCFQSCLERSTPASMASVKSACPLTSSCHRRPASGARRTRLVSHCDVSAPRSRSRAHISGVHGRRLGNINHADDPWERQRGRQQQRGVVRNSASYSL